MHFTAQGIKDIILATGRAVQAWRAYRTGYTARGYVVLHFHSYGGVRVDQ